MTPTTISPEGTPPVAPVTPPATPPAGPDAADLQRQIDELKTTNAELKRTGEFWYGKASEKAPAAPAPAPAAEAEPEVDILELATKGGKAFNKYLENWAKQNGFVKGEEMNTAISEKARELAKQTELVGKYPDLRNDKSEFFQATALEYGNLKKAGIGEALAMEMAAERVELRFLREGKTKTPAQVQSEKEASRKARATAGGGDHGGRRAEAPDETDTEMTDEQKNIAIRMLVDDNTTPEQAIEKYKQRATKGVAMRLK